MQLQLHNIRVSHEFVEERINILQDKGDTSITHYQVSLGWFIFRVDILNLKGEAKEWGTPISRGGFGEVMTGYTYRHRVYAVKRCMVESLNKDTYTTEKTVNEYHKKLYEVMKECCITKVCGVFEMGPRPVQPMGFDIITYDDCIDFCMEKCWDYGKVFRKIEDKDEKKKILKKTMKELKNILKMMRMLHLIHGDIKPDNILFSPGWKKIVLIDFGLAKFIRESVKEETETYFFGTPKFAGEEMNELLQYNAKGFVNLYKNDYQMLNKTE